jgi:hypothetical protein
MSEYEYEDIESEESRSIDPSDMEKSNVSSLFAEQSTVKEDSRGRLDPINELLPGALDQDTESVSFLNIPGTRVEGDSVVEMRMRPHLVGGRELVLESDGNVVEIEAGGGNGGSSEDSRGLKVPQVPGAEGGPRGDRTDFRSLKSAGLLQAPQASGAEGGPKGKSTDSSGLEEMGRSRGPLGDTGKEGDLKWQRTSPRGLGIGEKRGSLDPSVLYMIEEEGRGGSGHILNPAPLVIDGDSLPRTTGGITPVDRGGRRDWGQVPAADCSKGASLPPRPEVFVRGRLKERQAGRGGGVGGPNPNVSTARSNEEQALPGTTGVINPVDRGGRYNAERTAYGVSSRGVSPTPHPFPAGNEKDLWAEMIEREMREREIVEREKGEIKGTPGAVPTRGVQGSLEAPLNSSMWGSTLGDGGGKSMKREDIDASTLGSHPSVDRKKKNYDHPEVIGQVKREPGLYSDQPRTLSRMGLTPPSAGEGSRAPRTVYPSNRLPPPILGQAEVKRERPLLSDEETRGGELRWDNEADPSQREPELYDQAVLLSLQEEVNNEMFQIEGTFTFLFHQLHQLAERQSEIWEEMEREGFADVRRELLRGKTQGGTFMAWLTLDQVLRNETLLVPVELLCRMWEDWKWERDLVKRTKRKGEGPFLKLETREIISTAMTLINKCYEDIVDDWGLATATELLERTRLLHYGLVERDTIPAETGRIFPSASHEEILNWYLRLVPVLLQRERERDNRKEEEREVSEFLEEYPGPAVSNRWETYRNNRDNPSVDCRGSMRIFSDHDHIKTSPKQEFGNSSQQRREQELATLGFDNKALAKKGKEAIDRRVEEGRAALEKARREREDEARALQATKERIEEEEEEWRRHEELREQVKEELRLERLEEIQEGERAVLNAKMEAMEDGSWAMRERQDQRSTERDGSDRRPLGQLSDSELIQMAAKAGYNYGTGKNKEYASQSGARGVNRLPSEIHVPTVKYKVDPQGPADQERATYASTNRGGNLHQLEEEEEDMVLRTGGGSVTSEVTTAIAGFEPGETRAIIIQKTMAWMIPELRLLGFESGMLEETITRNFPALGVKTKQQNHILTLFKKVASVIKPQTKDNFISISEWFRDLNQGCTDHYISLRMRIRFLDRTGGLKEAREYEQFIRRVQELMRNIDQWLPEYDHAVDEREGQYWLIIWMKVQLKLIREFHQQLPVEVIVKGVEKELDHYVLDLQGEDVVNNQFYKILAAYQHINNWLKERSSNLGDSSLYIWRILTNWLSQQKPYGPMMMKHLDIALKQLGTHPELVFPADHGYTVAEMAQVRRGGQGGATYRTYEMILLKLKERANLNDLHLQFTTFGEMGAWQYMYNQAEDGKKGNRRGGASRGVNSVATDFSSISMNTTTTAAAPVSQRRGNPYPVCGTCNMHHSRQGNNCPFVNSGQFNAKAFLDYRSVRLPNEKGESTVSPFWIKELQTRAFKALKLSASEGKKVLDQLKAEAKKLPVLSKEGMNKLASHTQKFVAVAEKEGYANIQELLNERGDVSRINSRYGDVAVNQVRRSRREREKADTESDSEFGSEDDGESVDSTY